jgi:hypothetical protein
MIKLPALAASTVAEKPNRARARWKKVKIVARFAIEGGEMDHSRNVRVRHTTFGNKASVKQMNPTHRHFWELYKPAAGVRAEIVAEEAMVKKPSEITEPISTE